MALSRHADYGATFCSQDCLDRYERSMQWSWNSDQQKPVNLQVLWYLRLCLVRQLGQERDGNSRLLLDKQLTRTEELILKVSPGEQTRRQLDSSNDITSSTTLLYENQQKEASVATEMIYRAQQISQLCSQKEPRVAQPDVKVRMMSPQQGRTIKLVTSRDTSVQTFAPLREAGKLDADGPQRAELARTATSQFVVQRVAVGGSIGEPGGALPERHPGITQYLQTLEGQCEVSLSSDKEGLLITHRVVLSAEGEHTDHVPTSIVIPPDQYHLVRSIGSTPLLIFSIYSPPESEGNDVDGVY